LGKGNGNSRAELPAAATLVADLRTLLRVAAGEVEPHLGLLHPRAA